MKIQYQSSDLIIFESALYRTTSSLIIGKDYILLIDPNWLPHELEFIHQTASQVGKNKAKYLLFTHSDYDHIIGYGRFRKYRTIASHRLVQNPKKEAIISEIKQFHDSYYILPSYPIVYPKIDIIITEKTSQLELHSDSYNLFAAAGHTADSLIIYQPSKGILIVGDYLSNIEFPYIYDNFQSYQSTLELLEELEKQEEINILVVGHGDYTTSQNQIKKRIAESKNYLEELQQTALGKQDFDLKKLFDKYKFPLSMHQYHKENLTLLQKEIANTKKLP